MRYGYITKSDTFGKFLEIIKNTRFQVEIDSIDEQEVVDVLNLVNVWNHIVKFTSFTICVFNEERTGNVTIRTSTFLSEHKFERIEVPEDLVISKRMEGGRVLIDTLGLFGTNLGNGMVQLDCGVVIKINFELIPIRKAGSSPFFPITERKNGEIEKLKKSSEVPLKIGDRFIVKPYDELVAQFGENEELLCTQKAALGYGVAFFKGHSWICGQPLIVDGFNEELRIYYGHLEVPNLEVSSISGTLPGTILYTTFNEDDETLSIYDELPIVLHESLLIKL